MPAADSTHLGSDPELVTAAQNGDEDAFVALYERHAPIAWRTSLAITGHPDEASAVLAEGFARTFTAIRAGKVDPGTTLRAVLLTSVRNAVLDRRREQSDTAAVAPHFDYADNDEAKMIGAAFAPLPERWRTALWLTEVEGLRAKQIAPVVGLTSPTTMTMVGRAHSGLGEQYLNLHVGSVNDRTCSRSVARLGSYASGTLPPADVEKLERHLRLCDACADRNVRLRDAPQRLRALALPLPAGLVDDARTAWAAAVSTPAGRTGMGLSPTAEKVLAGVSAVAAAVGVLGATMFGASNGGSDDRSAAAAAPAASEQPEPDGDDDPLAGVTPVDLPSAGGLARSGPVGDSLGAAARNGTATTPGGNDGVIGASDPGGTRTPASDIDPTDPRDGGPGTTDGGGAEDTSAPPPVLTVETEVADIPVSIEVGEDPGINVGPASLGSSPEPEPESEPDDSTISVGGELEPLAPVVEPVDDVVTETIETLGL